ncbi:MAG TPA: choice-of-anchor tandem repeat GloVer-containing protein [Candidatus Baltobacteraceae bacterium]
MIRPVLGALLAIGVAGCSAPGISPSQYGGSIDDVTHSRASSYRIVYRFPGGAGGQHPAYGALEADGNVLFGTTEKGGAKDGGVVYALSAAEKVRVLHVFGKGQDGARPVYGLTTAKNYLYGTTTFGGGSDGICLSSGCGTVFRITRGGTEQIVHAFQRSDGSFPYGIVMVAGTLYGITSEGGKFNRGTAFSLLPNGRMHVLHEFGAASDGSHPIGTLLFANGALFGTTRTGPGSTGAGIVFRLSLNGVERILHVFKGKPDGASPAAGLIKAGKVLYGTTQFGGTRDFGTVFSITQAGAEHVIHSFTNRPDGLQPLAALTVRGATFYGTTVSGGANGGGTIYSLTAAGSERVLHSFGSGSDGFSPFAALTLLNGTLYGTTANGGNGNQGTLYAFTP